MVKQRWSNKKVAISKNHYSITLWWFLECVSDSDSPRPESESFFLIGLRPIKSWWCPTEWSPTEQSEWLDDLPSFSLALNKWVIKMGLNVNITNKHNDFFSIQTFLSKQKCKIMLESEFFQDSSCFADLRSYLDRNLATKISRRYML